MVIINTVSEKYFSLNGINFAKIYQPLKQGSENIGIYNVNDTRHQILSSTRFSNFLINGETFGSQELVIEKLLEVVYLVSLSSEANSRIEAKLDKGGYSGTAQDLKNEIDSKAFEGLVTYQTLADLQAVDPVPSEGTPAKVVNDSNLVNNGYYSVVSGAWLKDADLYENTVQDGNTVKAVTGEAVYSYVPEVYVGKETGDRSKVWLDQAKGKYFPDNELLLIKAIRNIFIEDAPTGVTFRIITFSKTHSVYGNRIIIQDSNGQNYLTDNALNVDGSVIDTDDWNLLKIKHTASGATLYIEIDYSILPSNTLIINGGNVYINPNQHVQSNLFIKQWLERSLRTDSSVKTLVKASDIYNKGSFVFQNMSYQKGLEGEFEGGVLKISALASGNYFRLLDNFSPALNSDNLDFSRKLFVEMDYRIISGSWRFVFWTIPSSATTYYNLSTLESGKVKKVSFSIELNETNLGSAAYINYFDCTSGTGELWVSNIRFYQSYNDIEKPLSGNMVNPESAIALNSSEINKEKIGSFDMLTRAADSMKSICLSGSSITWGGGNLKDSFGGYIDKHLIKKQWSNILEAEELQYSTAATNFLNPKTYTALCKQVEGVGSKVTFKMYGDELAICQVKKRTSNYGIMRVKADGVLIGQFDNKNRTLGSDSDSFTGDGNNEKFMLSHPSTYNHSITINGVTQSVQINEGGYGATFPSGVSALIIRNLDSNGEPKHVVWFSTPPANGASISVSYDYGRVIMHEKSTCGQTTDDQTNESNYGDGNISFDPASPANLSSGLEYRSIDKDAFFIHTFEEYKNREIEIEIIGGSAPYFIVDFVSNKFHNFMNAGIGGWQLSLYTNNDRRNDLNNFFKEFIPDLLINECATNDDWSFNVFRIFRDVTMTEAELKRLYILEAESITYNSGLNNFTVQKRSGIIDSITRYSLTCSHIVGSGVVVGDIIRIGNYYGDNKQVAVREVSSVNTTTGVVTWRQPLNEDEILNIDSISDLVGAEVAIRDLSGYQDRYETFIEDVQRISARTKILIANAGLSNYFTRRLWGYDIIHSKLCKLYHNVGVIDVTEWLYYNQKNNVTGNVFQEFTANGSLAYDLSLNGHWQGWKVFVDGVDVYGVDCYIESGYGITVIQSETGVQLEDGQEYTTRPSKLVFFRNAPSGGTVRVERADKVWSNDFAHTNPYGNILYGKKYIEAIKNVL